MTFVMRIRSNPGSEVTADYECPTHGMLTARVTRGYDGDPPEAIRCTRPGTEFGMCGLTSPWRPSAPGAVRVKRGELVRGKGGERPPDRYVMDTRPLADGMPIEEFRARRAMVHRDESLRRVRQALGRTGKVYR
jgi:hypothetical protein